MAAGRTSNSSSGGGAQWGSTRTRVSVGAHGSSVSATTTVSSSYEHTHVSSSTQGSPLGGVTGTSSSPLAAELRDDDEDDGNDNAAGLSTSNNNPLYGESEDEYQDDDDEDEWEDLGYNSKPVFRDFKFPGPLGDADDSEYAPSDTEEKDKVGLLLPHAAMSDDGDDDDDEDLSASDLEDEEEESSVAGLFASVIRQFGGAAKKTKDDAGEDPSAFTEQDREFWATPEEKQQWVARFDAANKQFVHKYGCRIDSPAHPEAKAKLRREKKKKNVYALILFALCVAYLVQLVAISTNSVLTVQSVVDGVKNAVQGIPHVYQSALEKLSSLVPEAETEDNSDSPNPIESPTRYEAVVVTISEADDSASVIVERVVEVDDVVTQVLERPVAVNNEPTADATAEQPETTESSAGGLLMHSDSHHREEEHANLVLSSDGVVNAKDETMPVKPSRIEKEPEEQVVADYARVTVQLCSKLLNRLVKSKYDQKVKDAAVRACEAAVAIAPQDSADWLEACVLRGDLWSLVSEFDAADKDYNAAATSVTTSGSQTDQSKVDKLSQEIQMKILANRWINMFTRKNNYKQLRQEVVRVAKAADQYSAPIRSLATDWLLVFKKKKQPVEVLTVTRLWTLQRLEYA